MNKFIPDFSFDNNIIINEINSFDKNLYNEIYILDVGEQKENEYKFGDLIMVRHNLINYYHILHLSILYDNHCPYEIGKIKNLLNNSFNSSSFNQNYKEIRNFIYGSNRKNESNELIEIKSLLSKIRSSLQFDIDNIKFKILNWMLMASDANDHLPIAADKFSK